jgi:hypothetical protein
VLPNQHLKTMIAISAIAAPPANANPRRADPLYAGCGYSIAGPSASDSSVNAAPTFVCVESKSGFDWGDAGIGAAGVLALALVAFGLILVVRSSRSAPTGRGSTSSRAAGMLVVTMPTDSRQPWIFASAPRPSYVTRRAWHSRSSAACSQLRPAATTTHRPIRGRPQADLAAAP